MLMIGTEIEVKTSVYHDITTKCTNAQFIPIQWQRKT